MCSVSVLSGIAASGERFVRVACNRDELRSRPAALPPVRRQFGSNCALIPIDPVADGTWIAVTSAGLGFALLNLNEALGSNGIGQRSRGLIVPDLLCAETLDEATDRIARLDAAQFAPFRLVLLNSHELMEFVSGGEAVELRGCRKLKNTAFFTSSGLGDQLVDGPRREVFHQFLGNGSSSCDEQDALHSHSWPDRPHLSICMNRSDAQTVSYTTLQITPAKVTLDYHAGAPGTQSPSWSLSARRNSSLIQ